MISDDLWLSLRPFTAEKAAHQKLDLHSQSSPVFTSLCLVSTHLDETHSGASLQERMSSLEKLLIFLFVLMTSVCVGLIAIYFTGEANSTTNVEGECESHAVH